jgi:ABC-type glycerol-3-phosphate transport system substrate-binding protein
MKLAATAGGATLLAACAPQVITEEVIVKETVMVEGEAVEITKIVEEVVEVEKVVEVTAEAPAEGPATGEIVVWFPWQDRGQEMVDSFNEAGLGINATFELGDYDGREKTFAALAAGTPADVGMLGRWQHADLAARNAIYPLDEMIDNARGFEWEQLFERLRKDSTVWGKRWVVPLFTDTRALFYNKRLMEEAGLDPEVPPTTFDELTQMSVAVTKRDEGGRLDQVGFTPSFGNPPVWLWTYTMLWVQDSDFTDEDMTKCTLMDKGPEGLTILKAVLDAQGGYGDAKAFTQAIQPGEGLNAFSSEKVAFAMDGQWQIANYEEFAPDLDYGLEPGPVLPEYGIHANYDGGGGFYLFKAGVSQNPRAAWEFVDYHTSFDVQLKHASGSIPSRADVTAEWEKEHPNRPIFASTAATCGWIPMFLGRAETNRPIADAFDRVLIEDADPVAELQEVADLAQQLIDTHNQYDPG